MRGLLRQPRIGTDKQGIGREVIEMKNSLKVDVVTRKKGRFRIHEAVKKSTIRVSVKDPGRRWNRLVSSEEERLAALCMIWEEELTKEQGK